MKIKITCDNAADLRKEDYEKFNISTIAIPVILGEEEFPEIDPEQIYSYVEKTKVLPKTAALNSYAYGEFFDSFLKDYDAVVHVNISSGISCSNQNAKEAASTRKNVYVVDSESLCIGTGLLALVAAGLNDGKNTAEFIYNETIKTIPKLHISFVLEKLDYMRKGGRCSAIQLLGANLFKIKPSLILKDTKIQPHKRYKGKQADVLPSYVDFTLEENKNYDKEVIYLPHTKGVDEVVFKNVEEKLKAAGFKKIIRILAGGVITSHCGEGTFGLSFLNK